MPSTGPDKRLIGRDYRSGALVAITLAQGRIAAIEQPAPGEVQAVATGAEGATNAIGAINAANATDAMDTMDAVNATDATNAINAMKTIDAAGATIAAKEETAHLPLIGPGLVDLQVNGLGGRDFNAVPIPPGTTGAAARLLAAEGVTAFCPTVITGAAEDIAGALRAIARDCRDDPDAAAAVAGIHLEGPFISPEDGPRGAHDRRHVRPPDWELFSRWQDAAEGRIKILTLSPEWPDSAAFIARCAASGVLVSIGHTAASPAQIAEAVAAGARMSTHLGNGAHLLLPRHPNYIWEQLAQDALHACLIADGYHLPDQVLKVALRAKGERALLVSDAVSLSGMPPGTYETPVGGRVTLTAAGRLHLADDERLLAGSAQPLRRGVGVLAGRGLAPLRDAWEMASLRPAALLGLPQSAGLAVGAPDDLTLFDVGPAGDIAVRRVLRQGKTIYRQPNS